jgi:hypothetical protein
MRNVNTILPKIDIEKHIISSLTDILIHTTPICLYTYDTCQACYNDEFYVSTDNKYCYDIVNTIVSDLYGRLRMDNKITLEFNFNIMDEDRNCHSTPLYLTYKDGSITLSSQVHFWSTIDGVNAYRVIKY